MCERAEWDTTYLANGALAEYRIIGTSNDKRRFTITDETPSSRGGTGTTATLTNLIPQQASLDSAKAVPELNKLFALYLKQYPQVRLSYDGDAVDPSILEDTRTNYPLPAFTSEDGRSHEVTLTIIEWNIEVERGRYLCTEGGITLRELPPGSFECFPVLPFSLFRYGSRCRFCRFVDAFSGEAKPVPPVFSSLISCHSVTPVLSVSAPVWARD